MKPSDVFRMTFHWVVFAIKDCKQVVMLKSRRDKLPIKSLCTFYEEARANHSSRSDSKNICMCYQFFCYCNFRYVTKEKEKHPFSNTKEHLQ